MPTPNQDFYLSLIRFIVASKQQLAAVCEPYGLTGIQAITLLLINENQPQPMKNLCNMFRCDASNVTGIIDGLEKRGLVSRQSDPNDRRVKVIFVEPSGRRMQQQILADLSASQHQLLGALTAQELQQFIQLVTKAAHSCSE